VRHGALAAAAAGFALLTAGCGSASGSQPPAPGTSPVTKAVAGFTGKGLQTAEDDARAAGFRNLASHDATGRGRVQILDIDWKVCFQSPAAGATVSTSTRIDFGVVKLAETCPPADQGRASPSPVREGQPMPDLVGKSLNDALSALPASTSITSTDVSGHHRLVIVPTNWQVCSQQPGPGSQFTGQPVSLGVVKYGERCP